MLTGKPAPTLENTGLSAQQFQQVWPGQSPTQVPTRPPQGNPGLPNLQYHPKYQVGTNLQPNTNWLSGLPNLQRLFNPPQAAPTGNILSQDVGQTEGTGVGPAEAYDPIQSYNPPAQIDPRMGAMFGGPVGALGTSLYNQLQPSLLSAWEKGEDIAGTYSEATFSPEQQQADNPEVMSQGDWEATQSFDSQDSQTLRTMGYNSYVSGVAAGTIDPDDPTGSPTSGGGFLGSGTGGTVTDSYGNPIRSGEDAEGDNISDALG